MTLSLKTAGLALAATGLALSGPASAAPAYHAAAPAAQASVFGETTFNHGRDKYRDRRDYRNYGRNYDRRYDNNYAQPVYRDTQVWRGDDGRYYCKKENGTTGLLIAMATALSAPFSALRAALCWAVRSTVRAPSAANALTIFGRAHPRPQRGSHRTVEGVALPFAGVGGVFDSGA